MALKCKQCNLQSVPAPFLNAPEQAENHEDENTRQYYTDYDIIECQYLPAAALWVSFV